jgi:hypothetical protein
MGMKGILVLAMALLVACTEQQRARSLGGTATTKLPECHKLVVATWKDDSLWMLYRPMRADERPESYTFHEDSSFGVLQGKMLIHEHCGR